MTKDFSKGSWLASNCSARRPNHPWSIPHNGMTNLTPIKYKGCGRNVRGRRFHCENAIAIVTRRAFACPVTNRSPERERQCPFGRSSIAFFLTVRLPIAVRFEELRSDRRLVRWGKWVPSRISTAGDGSLTGPGSFAPCGSWIPCRRRRKSL